MSIKFFLVINIVTATGVLGDYESAGCSDEGCGIPCYLKPAEDKCHYAEHATSCDGGGASDLEGQLGFLNNSLVRLKEKLIQKGIIPAGDTCRPLPYIDNGGVLYTDLLITPGVIGRYVCEEGYSLHGHSRYECAVDGVWLGNDTAEKPVCESSQVICDQLITLPYGHVSYQTVDTTKIQPGDVVTYSCDPPYILEGAEYRICMKNGSWNSKEPKCKMPPTDPSGQSGDNGRNNRSAIAAGVTVGVLVGIMLTVIAVLITVKVLRKRQKKSGEYLVIGNEQEDTDGNKEERSILKEEVKRKTMTSKSEVKFGSDVETVQATH